MEQIRVSGPLLKGRLVATTAAGVTGTVPGATTPAGITSLRHDNVDNDEDEHSTMTGTTGGTTTGTTTAVGTRTPTALGTTG